MKILLDKIFQEIKKAHSIVAMNDLKDICRESKVRQKIGFSNK